MKTLLLVDGSSYLYRAFHALPDLRTSSGEPTGALRGFIGMLRTLRAQVPHDYCACVFDAKGRTFRDDLYAEYKAHRPPMPEALVTQLPYIKKIIDALNLPSLVYEGYEADDLICTLVRRAREEGFAVEITVRRPCACAWRASVPITSSASIPSISRTGQPSAVVAAWIGATCAARSGGINGRCALYCG